MSTEKRESGHELKVAAFDFDGTITDKDTFVMFLKYWAGPWGYAWRIFVLLPMFLAYGLRLISRNRIKRFVVRRFFKNRSVADYQAKALSFCETQIPGHVRAGAIDEITRLKGTGYTLYIVSASLEDYLKPFAAAYGFEDVLATQLETIDGRLTGELRGENCWGPEKVRRLEKALSRVPASPDFAFGDTRGDKELLESSKTPVFRPFRLTVETT